MKKEFDKPVCETISFGNDVIRASGCSCNVPGLGDLGYNCTADGKPQCECGINYNPAVANCIPCDQYQ